jgi:hypothetical protein
MQNIGSATLITRESIVWQAWTRRGTHRMTMSYLFATFRAIVPVHSDWAAIAHLRAFVIEVRTVLDTAAAWTNATV